MSATIKTALIIPCYNEAERLPTTIFSDFIEANPTVFVLFVNDGSKDNTIEVLDALVESHHNARSLDLSKNGGKSEAVRQGVLWIQRNLKPDYFAYWDADLATPLDDVLAFTESMQERPTLDVAIGARLQLLGRHISRKLYRHIYGRIFATATYLVTHIPVYDTQCGAKMFRANSRNYKAFANPFVSRWIFDVEILVILRKLYAADGLRFKDHVYEFPLHRWKDVAGSKVGVSDAIRAFFQLLQIFWRYERHGDSTLLADVTTWKKRLQQGIQVEGTTRTSRDSSEASAHSSEGSNVDADGAAVGAADKQGMSVPQSNTSVSHHEL